MSSLARQDAGHSHGREPRPDAARFCTHCGVVSDDAPQRVCHRCGLGVVLSCAREALGEAFLVVTHDLRVSAASASAEELLGEPAEALVGERLLSIVSGGDELPRHVTRAAMGSRRIARLSVASADGRRLEVRIAACGDPAAALVVLT